MKDFLRYEIQTIDRVGMVYDVLRIIAKNNINVISMEVLPCYIYIKLDSIKEKNEQVLFNQIVDIKGVVKADKIRFLPYEKRERHLKATIDSITNSSMICFDDIIGKSEKITRIKEISKSVSKSDSTILISGESGTGKELFARSIHMASLRKNKPFVPINCAALPDALLESELFGYEDGAFTGAKKGGKQGLFEFAKNGTVFLDEIAELPIHLQVKLLRALQDGRVRRIGSNQESEVDVRIIAATNKDVLKLVRDNSFREDLYYRLNVIPIHIPPLRERKEDIPILVNNFINKLSKKMHKNIKEISKTAIQKLIEHDWPGNVRELENIIERATNLTEGEKIFAENILINGNKTDSLSFANNENKTLKNIIEEIERSIIEKAITTHKTSRAAGKALGVSHTTILNKLKKYNLM